MDEAPNRDVAIRGTGAPAAFDLTPRSLAEAMQLAEIMAKSDLVPKDYHGKPGNVLIAVQMGLELGLAPMASIQNIAVINGKPGVYGDAGKALLLARGFQIEESDVDEIRKGGVARCTITRPGHAPVTRTFSQEDAKKAGLLGKQGPWSQYPERMMAWRVFWWVARDAAADVLKGLGGREELEDISHREPRNITPQPSADELMPRRASAAPGDAAPATDQAVKVSFVIGNSQYETNGFTEEQMRRSFELAKSVDEKHGKNTAARLLREEFAPATSRNDLT
jgi:hypothetical protein